MRVDVKGPVTSVYFDVSAGWEQTLYLSSDVHWDSIYCNRALFKQHMERMNKINALGILAGDVLDLMQGRFDPRRSMEELRPEYRRNDYYDFVSDDAAKFFKPYAKNILLMARGNHELSVVKNANTDPFSNMVRELHRGGAQTVIGGFGGWIRLMFSVGGVPKTSLKIKYFHGAGSEAPVTRGVIQTNRQAVYLPDANIVLNGHNHNCFDEETEILTPTGWKSYKELLIGSQVMTYNRDTGELEWNPVEAVHTYTDYTKLIHLEGRAVDLSVTDQHGLWLAYGDKDWRVSKWQAKEAKDAYGKNCVYWMRTSGYEHNSNISITDARLRVLAWIMTEGSIEGNSRTKKDGIPGVIRISQSDVPDGRLEALEYDLQTAGIRYTKTQRKTNNKVHRNYDAYRYNLLDVKKEWEDWINKFIDPNKNPTDYLFQMSLAQRRMFIDTWILADGSVNQNSDEYGCFQLSTNCKTHVDFLQSILFRSGYRSISHLRKRDGVYWISCTERETTTVTKENWSEVPYSGTVWCVTVPNHTVVVRRSGKILVTMNSYIVPIIRERISNKGVLYTDTQYHIRTPGYKQDYADGSGGWTVERGGVPKPIGCAWVRLAWQDDRVVVQPMIDICGPDMLAPITESRPEPFVYPEP
jgi:hypothetical protein